MGSFYILGASGRHIPPDEWIECQLKLEAYEKRIAESKGQENGGNTHRNHGKNQNHVDQVGHSRSESDGLLRSKKTNLNG